MAVAIVLNQAGKPPGVAGRAREDFVTGVPVTASASGGPFLRYLWNAVHRPIDIFASTRASSLLATPDASSTLYTPIDVAGTYHLELLVDSGSGLGASADDIARITFYAGTPGDKLRGALAIDPGELPRRAPAFREGLEHNAPDALDPLGNPEGWSREWYRWFGVLQRLYEGKTWASGRVHVDGAGGAVLDRGFNVANVTRLGVGRFQVTFQRPLPDGLYAVLANARGAIGGSCTPHDELATGFVVERADLGGSLVDGEFVFAVGLGI